MKPIIYCIVKNKGVHSFYLKTNEGTFFLFDQDYRKSVQDCFNYNKGVVLDEAIDYRKCHRDQAIIKTKSKLPTYIRYIEKEYEIRVFEKTKDNNIGRRKAC